MRHPAIVDVLYIDLRVLLVPKRPPAWTSKPRPFRLPTAEELERLARAMEAKQHPVPLLFQDLAIVCDVGDDNKVRDLLLKYPTVGTALGDLLLQQGGLGDFEVRVAKRAAERVEATQRDADRPFRPGDMARDIAAATPAAMAQERPGALRELAAGALAKARAAIMSDTPERARFALDTYVSAARAADMADMRQAMTDYLDRLDGRADNVVRTPDDRELEGVRHFLKDGETPPSLGAPCAAAVDMINEMRGSPEWQKVANHMAQPSGPASTAESLAALADKIEGAALRWLHDNADPASTDARSILDALAVVQQARALRRVE